MIGVIPTRFHLYWAGSDADGAVTGFYWAVVETLPLPSPGTSSIPPLPGPRTAQYQYTPRSDSTFTFNVSEFRRNRQHAFYIYAVDDKGKGDPTPARFIFDALDAYPPIPVMDVAEGTGIYASLAIHGVPVFRTVKRAIGDSLDLNNLGRATADTVASGARLDFRWHADEAIQRGVAVRYKYKLDESLFLEGDSTVNSASYNTGLGGDVVSPGTKLFTLRAIDAAGGARELTRRFQVNHNPDTWFAGPDSNLVPAVDDPAGHRYMRISDWQTAPSGRGSLLSCDSLYFWPSERPPRKTFWEVYRDRLYVHAENDTINMNGFIIIQPGGADSDSPYRVKVDSNDPNPDTLACNVDQARVLRPGGPNGSPIGFRYHYAVALSPDISGALTVPSQSALFPLFDAASSFRQPLINANPFFTQSGRVYLMLRAVDGDGAFDDRIPDAFNARLLADAVDSGRDTDPYHVLLRQQLIMTFYVNRVPYFDYGQPSFFPKPPAYNGGTVASSPDRVLRLNMPGIDPDPFEPATQPSSGGGPSSGTVLRTEVRVTGTYTAGGVTRDTSFTAPRSFTTTQTINLASDAPYITGTHLTLSVELCDCANCEASPGTGRCVRYTIPVDVPPAAAGALGGGTVPNKTGATASTTPSRSLTP